MLKQYFIIMALMILGGNVLFGYNKVDTISDGVAFVQIDGYDLRMLGNCQSGRQKIDLYIDRYFGSQEEIKRQQELGLLPEKVDIYLPIYDVDYYVTDKEPEVDYLYLNGHKLGRVIGDNNLWIMNRFSVPLDYLNFPKSPGDSARNHFEFQIDALNTFNWVSAIDWIALAVPGPYPVILIHGVLSGPETWSVFSQQLSKQYGIPVYAVQLSGRKSIENNGILLKKYLEKNANSGLSWLFKGNKSLLQSFGVDKFNAIVHSKGGLDSRYYASQRGVNGRGLKNILQVSTPNGGSGFADYLAGTYDDLELELNDQEMSDEEFQAYYDKKLAKYSDVLGIVDLSAMSSLTCMNLSHFNKVNPAVFSNAPIRTVTGRVAEPSGVFACEDNMIPLIAYGHDDSDLTPECWGDGIVSVDSAHCLNTAIGCSPYHDNTALHTTILSAQAKRIISDYSDILTKRMTISSMLAGFFESPPGSVTAAVRDDNQEKYDYETENKEVVVESEGWHNCLCGVIGENHVFEGNMTNPCRQDLLFYFTAIPDTGFIAVNLPNGDCIDSQSSSDWFVALDYSSFFAGDGIWDVCRNELEEGESDLKVLLLEDSLPGEYKIRIGDDSLDKPRIVTATMIGEPAANGRIKNKIQFREKSYWVGEDDSFHLECNGINADGQLVDIIEKAPEIQVYYRKNHQNHYSKLENEILEMRDDGKNGDIVAGDGIYSLEYSPDKGGQYKFVLRVKYLDGNYELNATSAILGDYSDDSSRIAGVDNIEFLDEDVNGLIDKIIVPVHLEVAGPGTYRLVGCIVRNGQYLHESNGSKEFTIGQGESLQTTVNLNFNCDDFFQHGVDGKYEIADVALLKIPDDDFGIPEMLDEISGGVVSSGYVSHYDFEHPAIILAETGRDYLTDSNGDGMIDMLKVDLDATVHPNLGIEYEFSAVLYADDNNSVGCGQGKIEYLENGGEFPNAIIHLEFEVDKIMQSGYCGQFLVTSMLSIVDYEYSIVGGKYRTKSYSVLDFEENVNVIDVTKNCKIKLSDATINRDDGSMKMTIELTNVSGKDESPYQLVFWLVMPNTSEYRLKSPDGILEDGREYVDISQDVILQLTDLGNGDEKMDAGESVTVNLEIYSLDRSIPEINIIGFYADPPVNNYLFHPMDLDENFMLDYGEIEFGFEQMNKNQLIEDNILEVIKLSDEKGYRFDVQSNDFVVNE